MNVLLLILSLGGANWSNKIKIHFAPQAACEAHLIDESRLGIGVLAIDKKDKMVMGLSPYAGSLHRHIIQRLGADRELKEVLWMGELRYIKVDGDLRLTEANETSGFFGDVLEGKTSSSVPLFNNFLNLPASILADNFKGMHYDPKRKRLASELEGYGSVRHSIGNTLSIIQFAARRLLSQDTPEKQKLEVINGFRKTLKSKFFNLRLLERIGVIKFRITPRAHLFLLRWVILNLIEDHRLTYDQVSQILPFLSTLEKDKPAIEDFAEINASLLGVELEKITRLVKPTNSEMRVEIISIPE